MDGDVENVVPGGDVYLTPGHTAGTLTVCLDTTKGRMFDKPEDFGFRRVSAHAIALVE